MPLSDSLQERETVRSYDGWTNYMFSYDLKPWNDDDADNYDGHDAEASVDYYAGDDVHEDYDSYGGYEDEGGYEDYGGYEDEGDSNGDECYWDY
ncbi:hypothetical protein N7540_012692 [Penicillium herquei]|nr:hypothetical protein N7540_012692 [Penicillium herquei]